jgi:hypothetical protein
MATQKDTKPAKGAPRKVIRWTAYEAACEFDIHRDTLSRRLKQAGIEPGEDGKWSTKQIAAAVFGDIDSEKLRVERHRANLLELEENERRRMLIPAHSVSETWGAMHVAIRTAIWNCDAPEADRRRWLGELRDLKIEDYFTTQNETTDETEEPV